LTIFISLDLACAVLTGCGEKRGGGLTDDAIEETEEQPAPEPV
jgi:hypothetical protein